MGIFEDLVEERLTGRLEKLYERYSKLKEREMANLEALTAATDGLSSSIDAAVAALGSTDDQAAIDGITATLTDAKGKLDAALPAAPVEEPTV